MDFTQELYKRRRAMTGGTLIRKARDATLGSGVGARTGGNPPSFLNFIFHCHIFFADFILRIWLKKNI